MKKEKVFKLIIIVVILFILLVVAWKILSESKQIKTNTDDDVVFGQSDILDSYSYINEAIRKSEDWKQIVKDSKFQLGDTYIIEEQKYRYYGTYPRIDGSTVALTMANEFAWQHLEMDDEKEGVSFVSFNSTHKAFMGLIHGDNSYGSVVYDEDGHFVLMDNEKAIDLIIVTHPSEEELVIAADAGVELIIEPVCHDAFVFIAHKDNPVDSLTIEQIQKIYTGEITNWKEVGGNDEKIVAYQRQEGSGSQTGMIQLVMQGIPMADPIKVKVAESMSLLVEAVAEYKNESSSIGYTYLFYIDNLYKNPDIKVIEIEGIAPTPENIRNETYPLSTKYYAVIRAEDINETGGKFMDWMLSAEGQACIEQAGYIPLK